MTRILLVVAILIAGPAMVSGQLTFRGEYLVVVPTAWIHQERSFPPPIFRAEIPVDQRREGIDAVMLMTRVHKTDRGEIEFRGGQRVGSNVDLLPDNGSFWLKLRFNDSDDLNRRLGDFAVPKVYGLNFASKLANPSVIEMLISHGTDAWNVNTWDGEGSTPLHYAAENAVHPRVLEALLTAGADPDTRNRDNLTPLQVAEQTGNTVAVGALRRWAEQQRVERERLAAAERTEAERERQERELEMLRLQLAIAQAAAAATAGVEADAPPTPLPAVAGPGCLIPGYPNPTNLASLGFPWCPGDVNFQIRAYALQAAGAWCAITGGTSATPEQLVARHAEINETCDRLDAVGAAFGDTRCDCDLDSMVRP